MAKTQLFNATLSGLSSVVITNIDIYDMIEINIDKSGSAGAIFLEWSKDGGSTFQDSSGDVKRSLLYHASVSNELSDSGAGISAVGAGGVNLQWIMRRHDNANMRSAVSGIKSSDQDVLLEIYHATVVEVHNAFRLIARSSTFNAGRATIYGINL